MNKYQEALDYLKGGNLFGELSNDALEGIEELVDRATPNKPSIQEIGQYIIRYVGKCECGEFLARSHKYCHGCGQMVDWSKDE